MYRHSLVPNETLGHKTTGNENRLRKILLFFYYLTIIKMNIKMETND
jgi:hypothetical protein